jgi:hypothetical protein
VRTGPDGQTTTSTRYVALSKRLSAHALPDLNSVCGFG